MTTCDRSALGGGRCELDKGHEGKHRNSSHGFVFEWDDESQAKLARKHGSRFD